MKFPKASIRVLIVCDYYHPYKSGLSFVAKVLADELVKAGAQVTVLCHQHDDDLPKFELINGVEIHRAKPLLRINRASVSIEFFYKFLRLRRRNDWINYHLPMPEAGLLPIKRNQNLIITYQCDVPKTSLGSKLIAFLIDLSSRISISRSKWVVFSSFDYMESSRMKRYASSKSVQIFPFTNYLEASSPLFTNENGRNFGYFGRFTSEKGALFLIRAFQNGASIDDRLLMAGSSKVAGDSVFEKVKGCAVDDSRIILLPDISDAEIPNFYASLDVLCFPSLNSFEAFGITQVEALMAGVPVLTSDLPGVRVPVKITKLGKILPAGDIESWKLAIAEFKRVDFPARLTQSQEQAFTKQIAIIKYLELLV